MICNLSREFSQKTEAERQEIFRKLLASPVMHTDFTFDRVNGKNGTVIICLADGLVLYQGREKKGYEGIKNSPVELFQNILVSDHESVFLGCGSERQECLAHVERYLRSSIENEPDLTWNKRMLEWIKEAIHYRNEVVRAGGELEKAKTDVLKESFARNLSVAKEEYMDTPPGDYFRDGYNLYLRMAENSQDYLLFLDNILVPPTNNAAERAGRKVKRKAKAVMSFRSMEGHNYYLDGQSITETMLMNGENLIEGVAARFALVTGEV
ncbi:MAG: transposase [Lachnospiraceae bacterium]|nr:transposase [Lachnospiraceae bacterium]